MKTIILAGGIGSRLWPLSRTYFPKQFVKLKGMEYSMFQQTIRRALLLGGVNDIYVVTNKDYKFLVTGQFAEMGLSPPAEHILLEPQPKNTLPAIYYAVREIQKQGEDIAAALPSDHLIRGEQAFADAMFMAAEITQQYIVTFGIQPDDPQTEYGYIQPGGALAYGYLAESFREKPDAQTAQKYLEAGYLWNSGMFLFRTDVFAAEVEKHCPQVAQSYARAEDIAEFFEAVQPVSIDYGVMEKSHHVAVVPLHICWNDMGGFAAFYANYDSTQDKDGNITFGDEMLIHSRKNVVYSDSDKAVALVGVEDMVVVDQKDALLICKKDEAARVKEIVDSLKKKRDPRADYHVTAYRPWGSFTVLEEGQFYKIKRLTVKPGEQLSYQKHYHRSEHWVVVQGSAIVVVDGTEHFLTSNQSIYVPIGAKHRLLNPGKMVLEVIEVQIGGYLHEDDIVRMEDEYHRE
jgi:mannose-1-phosphate guanylyltransferase/mannose-6-phosphate isomerase